MQTHLYLDRPDADQDFARELLAHSDASCYVHELCRSPIEPEITISA